MTTADRAKMYSEEGESLLKEMAPLLSPSPEEQVRRFVGSFVGWSWSPSVVPRLSGWSERPVRLTSPLHCPRAF